MRPLDLSRIHVPCERWSDVLALPSAFSADDYHDPVERLNARVSRRATVPLTLL